MCFRVRSRHPGRAKTNAGLHPRACRHHCDRVELIDVRVSHPCAKTYVAKAADEPGYTARVGEAAKEGIRPYQEMAQQIKGLFSAFVLESHGRFGASAWRTVNAMAARASAMSPFPREDEHYFAYEFARRLSLALQRGNALLLQQGLLRSRAATRLILPSSSSLPSPSLSPSFPPPPPRCLARGEG